MSSTPLTVSNLKQILCWLYRSESEYRSWSVIDLFVHAYISYHQCFQKNERQPSLEDAQARIKIDANQLLQSGIMPYYVEWFIRKRVYPSFVIRGDKPVEIPTR